MKYLDERPHIQSGDLLLCEGKGFVSTLIKMLTAQQISHVAVFIWINETLWVAEMKEFVGYRLRPASLWIDDYLRSKSGNLYIGYAPEKVYQQPDVARELAFHYRESKYGYLSLFRVWWHQLTGKRRRTRGIVCSTFVARIWEACGVKFSQTPAPGEFLRMCRFVSRVQSIE